MQTVAQLAKELGVSIPEVQECLRKGGVGMRRGAAQLYPADVRKVREQLGRQRWDEQQRRIQRESGVNIQLSQRNQTAPAVQPVKRDECCCCQLTVEGPAKSGPLLCPACVDHYELPHESIERRLARLGEHDQRMRGCYVRARAAADEYRQQRDSAYLQRDDWREAAIKLVHDHYDSGKGRCVRCAEAFPCRPWKLLEDLNRGFARRAETWACFTPEELERHLHPKRRRDADYREDWDDVDDETG